MSAVRAYSIECREGRKWLQQKWWWVILSTVNGQVIATSEMYTSAHARNQTVTHFHRSSSIPVKDAPPPVPPIQEPA